MSEITLEKEKGVVSNPTTQDTSTKHLSKAFIAIGTGTKTTYLLEKRGEHWMFPGPKISKSLTTTEAFQALQTKLSKAMVTHYLGIVGSNSFGFLGSVKSETQFGPKGVASSKAFGFRVTDKNAQDFLASVNPQKFQAFTLTEISQMREQGVLTPLTNKIFKEYRSVMNS